MNRPFAVKDWVRNANYCVIAWSAGWIILCFTFFGITWAPNALLLSSRLLHGPKLVEVAQDLPPNEYVRVRGRPSFKVGERKVRIKQSGVVYPVADYHLLELCDGSYVMVEVSAGRGPCVDLSGLTTSIPDEAREELGEQIPLLGWMLDTNALPDGGALVFQLLIVPTVGLVVALSVLPVIVKSWREIRSPRDHPMIVSLTRFGPLDEVVKSLEAELSDARGEIFSSANLRFTKSWIVDFSHTAVGVPGLSVWRIEDLVWIYKQVTVTTTRLYGVVPVSRSESQTMILKFRTGEATTGQLSDKTIRDLVQRMPWLVLGYSDELGLMWNARRETFVAYVDSRRVEMQQQSEI